MGRILFITGTDTGAGKTLLSALLLAHLRTKGVQALGMKPFCSGPRGDVRLLKAIQGAELLEDEINPFYFPEAVAPVVSARKHRRIIRKSDAVKRILEMAGRCECLVVEGCGGLMVPFGKNLLLVDLVTELGCEVIVAARNRLGVLNHSLLTLRALQALRVRVPAIVLMDSKKQSLAVRTNAGVLAEWTGDTHVFEIPFLRANPKDPRVICRYAKKFEKLLARVVEIDKF